MKAAREVTDLMKKPVISIENTTHVFDALQVARDHGIHHLAVTRAGSLCGIVCTCDLRDAGLNTPVDSVMHEAVVTLK